MEEKKTKQNVFVLQNIYFSVFINSGHLMNPQNYLQTQRCCVPENSELENVQP